MAVGAEILLACRGIHALDSEVRYCMSADGILAEVIVRDDAVGEI